MKIAGDETVAGIVVDYPQAAGVFERLGIDYCCSGSTPLAEACGKGGLDTGVVLEEIERELAGSDAPVVRWDEAPLDELIDHILETFHASLREELPRLESMARKVVDAHGDKEPDMLAEVLSTLLGLEAELNDHMAKEEQILFPMIRQGRGSMAEGPISVMHHEHDAAGAALARLRAVTDDYRAHPDACATWTALWHGLAELEKSLHTHIHLENNILFPRALAGAPGSE